MVREVSVGVPGEPAIGQHCGRYAIGHHDTSPESSGRLPFLRINVRMIRHEIGRHRNKGSRAYLQLLQVCGNDEADALQEWVGVHAVILRDRQAYLER